MKDAKILIVEDEVLVARSLEQLLRHFGYTSVTSVTKGGEAIATAAKDAPDLILMDIKLRNTLDGIETAERIRLEAFVPVIYFTAYSDEETIRRAKQTEPFAYLTKPVNEQELRVNIEMALYKAQLDKKLRASEERYRSVVSVVGEGIVLQEASGKITTWNIAAEDIFGVKADEVIGRTSIDYPWGTIHEDGSAFPGEEHPSMHTLRTGDPCRDVIMGVARADGAVKWISINTSPLVNGAGNKPYAVVISFRDITEQRHTENELRKNKARLEMTARAGDVGLWDWDIRSNKVYYSPEWKSQIGYEDHEIADDFSEWQSRLHPDDLDRATSNAQRFIKNPWPDYKQEFRFRHKDGSYRWILTQADLLRDDTGKPVRMLGCHIDITERKKTEEKIAHQENILRVLINASSDSALLLDDRYRIITLNSVAAGRLGKPAEELIGTNCMEFFPPEVAGIRKAMCNQVFHTGEPVRYEDTRGEFILDNNICPVFDAQGKVVQIAVFARDITEQRRADEVLKERERRYAILLGNLPGMVYRCRNDRDWTMQFVSEGCFALTGYRPEDLLENRKISFNELVLPEYHEPLWKKWQQLLAQQMPFEEEYPIRAAGGDIKWVWERGRGVFDNKGQLLFLEGYIEDVTERKKAGEALREAENKFRSLFENTINGVALHEIVTDDNGKPVDYIFLDVNPAFEKKTGISPRNCIGRRITEVIPGIEDAPFIDLYGKVALTGTPARFERYVPQLERYYEIQAFSLQPRLFATVFTDINERKKLENTLRQTNAELSAIYENAPVMMCVLDESRRVLYANRSFAGFAGTPQEQEPGSNRACGVLGCINALQDPRGCGYGDQCDSCQIRLAIEETFRTGISRDNIEFALTIDRDGGRREYVLLGALALIQTGDRPTLLLCLQDITARKQAEEILKKSEEYFRSLYHHAPTGYQSLDTNGCFITANQAWLNTFGYSQEEVTGRWFGDFLPPDQAELFRQRFPVFKKQGEIHGAEFKIMKKDGTLITASFEGRVEYTINGEFKRTHCILFDITERKHAEEALRESEERFRTVVETATDAIITVNRRGAVVAWNAGAERIYGYTPAEINGKSLAILAPERYRPAHMAWLDKVLSCEGNSASGQMSVEGIGLRKSGDTFPLESTGSVWRVAGEQFYTFIVRDISARKQAEAQLGRLMTAIEQADEVIVIADPTGDIRYVNPAFERVTGYTIAEALGKNPRILKSGRHDEQFYEELWGTITGGQSWKGHFINKKKDGSLYDEDALISPVKDAAGRIINFVAVKRDVTQELLLEAQLRQAQKMEAIGTLAGGIAHDFNNILGGIINYTQIALDDLNDRASVQDSLDWIMKLSDRAAGMVRQILAFSRKSEQEKQQIQLQSLIKESIKMLRGSIPASIEIRSSIDDQTGPVLADLTQMHQVLLNLCSNAAHAMKETGGRIDIALSNCILAEGDAAFPKLPAGEYVRLVVSDTGTGIEPGILGRIFDPYFTTKQAGEGTGMGLAVVHGIVEGHKGAIAVRSAPGAGSAFIVLLPRAADETQARTMAEHLVPRGSERILLVDDEESMVKPVAAMLTKLGYGVTSFNSSPKALRAFQKSPAAFDIVLCDQTMPQMTGEQLAGEILKLRPQIPIILMTGFSAMIDTSKAERIGIKALLTKPFPLAELAREIRRVLEGQ